GAILEPPLHRHPAVISSITHQRRDAARKGRVFRFLASPCSGIASRAGNLFRAFGEMRKTSGEHDRGEIGTRGDYLI
ncbi:MAG: hypothetical protein ACI4R9_05630, partial [Kiritimatiellia bacterium]